MEHTQSGLRGADLGVPDFESDQDKQVGACESCQESDSDLPLEARRALRFGLGHWAAITQQAAGGLHRTLPLWILPAVGLCWGPSLFGHRPVPLGPREVTVRVGATAATAVVLQLSWTLGYGSVSGARTALRLSRLTAQNMIAIQITCPHHDTVYAAAHFRSLGNARYVDGVFAWPRKHGAGRAIVNRLLARADAERIVLKLTALSPRVAERYRRVGFRERAWIYYMTRQPQAPPSHRHLS